MCVEGGGVGEREGEGQRDRGKRVCEGRCIALHCIPAAVLELGVLL